MVVVVEDGVGECLRHVTNLLGLCHEVQRAVLDELQDIRHAVRTVQVYVTLLLADERLIALGMEEFPRTDEVLHDIDVRTRLDVEITSIEEASDVQARDQFVGFILRICGRPLTMQVEMIALRCLQIALLEGLSVPGAIAFVHIHVIHVDRHPDIGSGIGNLIVDMCIDEEIIGLGISILDIVDTRFLNSGEVELHVVVLKISSP